MTPLLYITTVHSLLQMVPVPPSSSPLPYRFPMTHYFMYFLFVPVIPSSRNRSLFVSLSLSMKRIPFLRNLLSVSTWSVYSLWLSSLLFVLFRECEGLITFVHKVWEHVCDPNKMRSWRRKWRRHRTLMWSVFLFSSRWRFPLPCRSSIRVIVL